MKQDKIVTVVTGGGRGIGRAIALRMARQTAVMLVGRTEADLIATRTAIEEAGGIADYYVGDVAVRDTAFATVEKIHASGNKVGNLVLNAGMGKTGASHEFDPKLWLQIFDVNVHGSFWFVQACAPDMIEAKAGSITVISSTLGLKGCAFDTAYTATKHAVVGMARSLALEYAKHGITVVSLCPSWVESEMTTRSINGLAGRKGIGVDEARRIIEATSPQNRILPAEEVADMVALVADGTLRSLNGHELVLDGGSK